MGTQLLRRKSIDRLIADTEAPDKRLKKVLGPWSLAALGIGAIIGTTDLVLQKGTRIELELDRPLTFEPRH